MPQLRPFKSLPKNMKKIKELKNALSNTPTKLYDALSNFSSQIHCLRVSKQRTLKVTSFRVTSRVLFLYTYFRVFVRFCLVEVQNCVKVRFFSRGISPKGH